MSFTIDQGRIVDVAIGDYTGRAGLSEDGNEVAFAGNAKRFRAGMTGTVDGVPREVASAAASTVKGMIALALRPATDPAA